MRFDQLPDHPLDIVEIEPLSRRSAPFRARTEPPGDDIPKREIWESYKRVDRRSVRRTVGQDFDETLQSSDLVDGAESRQASPSSPRQPTSSSNTRRQRRRTTHLEDSRSAMPQGMRTPGCIGACGRTAATWSIWIDRGLCSPDDRDGWWGQKGSLFTSIKPRRDQRLQDAIQRQSGWHKGKR
jgi:hypothetical protein